MQIVTPKEAVGFERRMAKRDTLDHLKWQHDLWEEFAETPPPIPTQRLLFDRHASEAHRGPPELFLLRQGIRSLVSVCQFRRRDKVALRRALACIGTLFFLSCFHY